MVADYSTDFQRYLESVCTDEKYIGCQEFYTPTDAVDPQPVQRRKFPLRRLNLGLQVRTVVPKEQEGQASEKVEQLPVLEGLRKHQDNHVLLVGRPGSGKSTALERLLWEEAQGIDLTPPCPPLPCKGRGENYSPVRNKAALFPCPRRGGLGRGGEGLGERSTRRHAKIPVLVELRQYQTSVLDLIQAFLLRHELRLDKDNFGSYTAVEALGYIGSQAAVDALTQAFYHEDPYGRSEAVYELEKIGNQAAVDALIKALSHQDNILCLNAVEALGRIGNPAAVDALTQALNHEYSKIPREAVKALSKIGNSAAVKALIKAYLNTKNSKIRREAAEALDRIWNPPIESKSTPIKDSRIRDILTFDCDKF